MSVYFQFPGNRYLFCTHPYIPVSHTSHIVFKNHPGPIAGVASSLRFLAIKGLRAVRDSNPCTPG